MSDFFAQLEQQLREATRERPQRLRRARRRRAAAAGAVAILLAGGGVGLAAGLGAHDPAPHHAPAAAPTTPTTSPSTSLQSFRVAVLNGTTTPGLAHGMAQRLKTYGLRIGVMTNAPQQTQSQTRVYFRAGHQRDAALVASLLHRGNGGLWAARTRPAIAAIAGPDADVIVVVGSQDIHEASAAP